LIAILTSCLGLLGVVLYSLETRTKEIAIRKVLGSSALGMITVLSKNFFVLMIIALCIGLPAGYVLGVIILEQSAYKFDLNINLGVFVMATVFVIGLLTICTQAIRAALANPVAALKNE
jgi:putative ABC transport system permease protein